MVIIRDIHGNIIGKEASSGYVSTRTLRNRHEQELCDKQMGIVRDEPKSSVRDAVVAANQRRIERGLEPVFDNIGLRPCNCEDYPCCCH